MDAKALDLERTHACVFMAITDNGPLSMCAYNAQRDHYLHGKMAADPNTVARPNYTPIKFLKGRQRQQFLAARGSKATC